MIDAEFAIEKYLARAANRAWQVGRLNAHTQIIRNINCLRRYAPLTLPDHRDDDEFEVPRKPSFTE
jgi:cytochrome oxidase assembly protein ShyY1